MDPHDATALSAESLARRFDLLAADATGYALFLVDRDGRLVCWNLGAERLFGFRTDEVVGGHFSRFFSPEDVVAGQPEYELAAARESGHTAAVRWQVRKDGSRFWCRAHVTALYDEAKQLSGFARVMHDLTDTEASAAAGQRADGLAAANRAKEEFMAMLAHELRNPLSPVLNAVSILRLVRTDDPVIRQAVGLIERQVGQMVRLVDDLLDVSRITQGKLRLTTEVVDFRAVMNRAADSARPLLDARRHEFSLLFPTEPLWVTGDPARLEQIAVNLLTNAAKYTDTGGLVRMTVAREGADAVARVTDNGIGIPANELPHIFDLFTQVDASLSRAQGGLGIGLALVRTLVELQGGRVTAASGGPGKGSEFAVKFPVQQDAPPRVPTTVVVPRQSSGPPRRVLVVEDDIDSGDSLCMLLRLYGHDVRVARSGSTALEMATEFRPSLVLLDIGLPGMDGYEVARRLRADPEMAGATLCALSGYTPSAADSGRPQQAGFAHHFIKPVSVDALLGLLKTLG
ncbi:MAG TPA: ATP-binding protein [Urbifossiella sp.]|nr:ATP-binding protein [Urbifossiella sp.]